MINLDHGHLFNTPKHYKNNIKVIGVGGGGTNAVNHMIDGDGIQGVDFIVCNTDAQSLQESRVPNKLQLGLTLTQGLGAGTDPEQGEKAAIESEEQIKEILKENTKMVFITAGMGGGTGTGAAPVIARFAKEMGILTIAIVTRPFRFEGTLKDRQALKGIEQLEKACDTVLVILNDRLTELFKYSKKSEAFAEADNVLKKAAKSIAEVITVPGKVNVDFMDVRMVLKEAGQALMGAAEAEGEDRAERAITEALNSPLLDNHQIQGAQRLLFTMAYSKEYEITLAEQEIITDYIEQQVGDIVPIAKMGDIFDESLGKKLRITIIAAGFHKKEREESTPPPLKPAEEPPQQEIKIMKEPEEVVADEPFVIKSTWSQKDAYGRAHRLMRELEASNEEMDYDDLLKTATYLRNNVQLIDVSTIPERELRRSPFLTD
jgi:cell division protein FtsZ